MSTHKGFGPPKEKKKKSRRAAEREKAAKQYDKMRDQGGLEYEVYVRIMGKPNWVPMGAITVKASRFVSRAIYSNEKALLESAFRVAPMMKRYQDKLEYGYRLKSEKKDPIEVAIKPGGVGALGKGIGQGLSKTLGGLFKKKESE